MIAYAKAAGDVSAILVTASTLMQWLPPVAAVLTIVWTALRIYETKTVQGWIKKHKDG